MSTAPPRECLCLLDYGAVECCHADGVAAILIDGPPWGTSIVRAGGYFLLSSSMTGAEQEAREHFGELSEVVRTGKIAALQELEDASRP